MSRSEPARRTRVRFGAWPDTDGVNFRAWAPGRRAVEVVLEGSGRPSSTVQLEPEETGLFHGRVASARAGDRYRLRLDADGPWPDPASRFQPDGVHGPSEIIDPGRYRWTCQDWTPPALDELVVYELHVGTFSPRGDFAGVTERLPHLRDLGVTAIELMPVADFPGRWNWGYDGVSLFAPARCYGRPDDLRALVDAAHAHGIAVLLDVVYNHLGPDGAYLAAFAPAIFSDRHQTPWGQAINLDGPQSRHVRDFFVDQAVSWLDEYRLDGLRLDATHALVDESPTHFLAEFVDRVRAELPRQVFLIAEDHRNLATLVRPATEGGYGLDGVWSDDFHHEVRRALTGDADGYFADFAGTTEELATTVRQGWFYTGQYAGYFEEPRGTDPGGLSPSRFTFFTQNHDQVGNRAFGDRLNHQIGGAEFRAAAALLLLAPETPLLFMGQEWGATSPFLYFTDHAAELGRLVTEGRRREFSRFAAFTDPKIRDRIPDPQDPATFEKSRLFWSDLERPGHQATLRLHRALLALRRSEPLFRGRDWRGFRAGSAGADALWFGRRWGSRAVLVLVRLRGAGTVAPGPDAGGLSGLAWTPVLSTEDRAFAPAGEPITAAAGGAPASYRFSRPGALVLTAAVPS